MPRRTPPILTVLALTGAGAAAVAGAARRVRAGRRERRATERGVAISGRAERTAQVAAVGTKIAADVAVHKAVSRVASDERKEVLDRRLEERTVENVVDSLGQMKGLMMKLGQMESFTDDSLSASWKDGLASLQADAPTMSAAAARTVVEEELGAPVDRLFAEWEADPMAAASVGQVHGAVLHDGRRVAVKVQYPGAGDAIRADLDNLGMLLQLGKSFSPDTADLGGVEDVLTEMRTRLLEELDYSLEATQQARFADRYRDHPFVHVPDVVADRSATRVLTAERATGARFAEVVEWPQEERDLAAEVLFRFVVSGVFVDGWFNGDPHPGNYLFDRGGRVTFLDFGLVKQLTADERTRLAALPRAVLAADPDAFRAGLVDVGILRADATLDDDTIERRYGWHYDLLTVEGPTTVSWRQADVPDLQTLRDDPEAAKELFSGHGDPDTSLVIYTRVWRGLRALLARLEGSVDYRGVALELLAGGPPAGRLGAVEAGWRSRR